LQGYDFSTLQGNFTIIFHHNKAFKPFYIIENMRLGKESSLVGKIGKTAAKAMGFLGSLLVADRVADAIPTVYVVPEKDIVTKGESSYFDVFINSDGIDMWGIGSQLDYNNSNIGINPNGQILTSRFWQDKSIDWNWSRVNGTDYNLVQLMNLEGVSGDDAAFRVFFDGNTIGSTDISSVYTELVGINGPTQYTDIGQGSPLDFVGATITVQNNPIPEPTTAGLLALGAAGVALRGRRKEYASSCSVYNADCSGSD
jgi:hypothetical protein